MAKSIQQIIDEIKDIQRLTKEELAELTERVQVLEKKMAGVLAAPASKRGVKVPQTPRPDMLKELELGRDPKGT